MTPRIKKLIWQNLTGPKNLGVHPFPDPIEHYGPRDGHFVFCSLCCVVSCKASAPFAARLVFLLEPPKTFDYIPSLHAKEDNKVDGQYAGKLITMLP